MYLTPYFELSVAVTFITLRQRHTEYLPRGKQIMVFTNCALHVADNTAVGDMSRNTVTRNCHCNTVTSFSPRSPARQLPHCTLPITSHHHTYKHCGVMSCLHLIIQCRGLENIIMLLICGPILDDSLSLCS